MIKHDPFIALIIQIAVALLTVLVLVFLPLYNKKS